MSSKTKTIAFVVAALLAVGGGVYAFLPDAQDGTPAEVNMAQTAAPAELPATDIQQQGIAEQADANAGAKNAGQESKQPEAKAQDDRPTPKKLTKEQLTPPPLTEAEKLEKAAQQESNF